MFRLILLGMLSAAFFSSTFVLNRAMSVEGGHWLWTASLRFGFMLVFLTFYTLLGKGPRYLAEIFGVFLRFRYFWIMAGSIGFGVFYALLSFSASHAPGWIIATTWQVTILATPLVLVAFGRAVPLKGILLVALVFGGVMLVNLEYGATATVGEVLRGALPVLVAAFAYPVGNQMVWEATQPGQGRIPRIRHEVMDDSFARILLMTLGSLPFWLLLILLGSPPPPSSGQLLSTAGVALLSGIIATAIFFHARHLCSHSWQLAAVDATQSMEVVFSLMGEIIFLGGTWPGPLGLAGIALVLIGLTAYTRQTYAP